MVAAAVVELGVARVLGEVVVAGEDVARVGVLDGVVAVLDDGVPVGGVDGELVVGLGVAVEETGDVELLLDAGVATGAVIGVDADDAETGGTVVAGVLMEGTVTLDDVGTTLLVVEVKLLDGAVGMGSASRAGAVAVLDSATVGTPPGVSSVKWLAVKTAPPRIIAPKATPPMSQPSGNRWARTSQEGEMLWTHL